MTASNPKKSYLKVLGIFFAASVVILVMAAFAIYAGLMPSPEQVAPLLQAVDRQVMKNQALYNGKNAVEKEDWDTALQSYGRALSLVPDDREVLYSLANASAKAPGRELMALYWLKAYINSAPTGDQNAEETKRRLPELEKTITSNISKIVALAQGIVAELPETFPKEGYGFDAPGIIIDDPAHYLMLQLPQALVAANAVEGAYRIMAGYHGSKDEMIRGFAGIAEMQARTGDIDGARVTLTQMAPKFIEAPESYLQSQYESSKCPAPDMVNAVKSGFMGDYMVVIQRLVGHDTIGPAETASVDFQKFLDLAENETPQGSALLLIDGAKSMARTLARVRDCGSHPAADRNAAMAEELTNGDKDETGGKEDTHVTLEDAKAAYDRQDYQTALTMLKPLAEGGDSDAQLALAATYNEGKAVEKDVTEALKWYHRSAEQGNFMAQFALSLIYAEYTLSGHDSGRNLEDDKFQLYVWQSLVYQNPDCRRRLNASQCETSMSTAMHLALELPEEKHEEAKRLIEKIKNRQ